MPSFRAVMLSLLFTPAILVAVSSETLGRGEVADLRRQLEDGLKARRLQDRAFIGRVVTAVQNNQLQERLVKSLMRWAQKKNARFPFPYFERAVTEEARKLGVTI